MKGMGNFWIEDGETALFIGDSITDCGRRDANAPLGDGYVCMVAELATAQFPDRKIRYLNKGIGGNTILDLRERWVEDVLEHRPDRLAIKIGINDLHQHLAGGERAVSPEHFAQVYEELLEHTGRELGCPLLLITPFYISVDGAENPNGAQVLELLPRYIETVERMSDRYGTHLVRSHDLFQRQLRHREAAGFCPEPVHPNHAGHIVIADAVMTELTSQA